MRKILILPLLLFILFSAGAETLRFYQKPFQWKSPQMMGMGGAYVVDTSGFAALFTNPAGFVMDYSDVTLLAFKFDAITDPFALINSFTDGSLTSDLPQLVIDNIKLNGLGVGVDFGTGWVGKHVGIGLFQTTSVSFPQVDSNIGLEGITTTDTTLVLGYAGSLFFMSDQLELKIGGDVRPTYRGVVPLTLDQAFGLTGLRGPSPDIMSLEALAGAAIAFDAGVIAEYKNYSAGLTLRDIAHTQYNLVDTTLGDALTLQGSGSTDSGKVYLTPMSLAVGVGWEPDFGKLSWLLKSKIQLTYETPLLIGFSALDLYDYDSQSFFTKIHFGAEAKLFSVLYLRAGINSGYFTAGTGLDFKLGELNFAIYSEENGARSGQSQQLASTVELRFQIPHLGIFDKKDNSETE